MSYDAAYISEFPAFADKWLPTALKWAVEMSREHGGPVTAVAPGKSQFRDTELSRLPASVRRVSTKTMRNEGLSPVVIACWPDATMLDRIDASSRAKALVVLPWGSEQEIESWRVAHQAVDLLGKAEPAIEASIADPVVEQAMKSVTMMVNLSTGLAHPMDRPKAVWAFRHLKKAGHAWTPQEVETWAASNGWDRRHARDLAEISEKILAGRRLQAGSSPVRADIIEVWREKASQA